MKSRKPSAVAARVAQYAVLCLGAFFTLLPLSVDDQFLSQDPR